MDTTTVILVARYALTALGGILVAHGYINSGQVEQLTGAVLTILPIILGIISHKQGQAAVITAAATSQPVQATLTSPLSSPHA